MITKQELKELKLKYKSLKFEEVAKDFIENTMKFSFTSIDTKTQANRMLKCVEFGTKWQQEQENALYNEEEVLYLLLLCKDTFSGPELQNYVKDDNVKEWFNRFKKNKL